MAFTTLPTVTDDQAVRSSWGNLVKADLDDHEARLVALGGAGGDVDGPASATDNAIARFDSTTGKLIQNSGITVADGASGTLAGSNTGDVTLAGTPNYLTIVGQVLTRALIDLASHITGRLPFANLTAATAANRLFGRGSAGGAGDFQEIALGSGLSMSGTTLSATGAGAGALDDLSDVVITTPAIDQVLQHDGSTFVNKTIVNVPATALTGTIAAARMPALTGDVTTSAGAVATTITNDAVTNAKSANMAQSTIKGRAVSAGTGDPTDLTATQATAILDAMVGDAGAGGTKGLAPAPAAGDAAAGKFLKANGTWAAPAGSGDVVGPASSVDAEIVLFNSTTGKLIKSATGTGFVRVTSGVYTAAKLKRNITLLIGDGTNVISTGAVPGCVSSPITGTITKVRLLSSDASITSGSIVIDVWKDTYANYPPTVADTITASAKPTITTATKSEDSTLTGWTTSVTAGDVFRFNVDSVTSLKMVTIELEVQE